MTSSTKPYAALDVGSNTIRLLVAHFSDGYLSPIEDASEFVRLGKGVNASGELQEDRMAAAITAIRTLQSRALALGADSVTAVATSAVRDAANRTEFLQRVRDETGVSIQVLSGEEEARLTFLGATQGETIENGTILCDLGGGSAELIFATPRGLQWARSLQFGSGRLTELFIHHDPPTTEELQSLQLHVQGLLNELPPAEAHVALLTGGTATHMVSLLGKSGNRVRLTAEELQEVVTLVSEQTADRLVADYGVRPERAEVLPAGILAATTIVTYYRAEVVSVTSRGIREGIIVQRLLTSGS